MRHRWWLAALWLVVTWDSGAAERSGEELSQRSKAMVARVARDAAHANAPFRAAHDPIPGLLHREDALSRMPRAACEAHARDLCYDLVDRRIVYRPVRRYMPRFDGLTPESVSLRSDRVNFRYSFR